MGGSIAGAIGATWGAIRGLISGTFNIPWRLFTGKQLWINQRFVDDRIQDVKDRPWQYPTIKKEERS
jgi:hypothetical protein